MNQTTPTEGRTLTSWPPDVTTLGFFLWIYVKNLVYWVKNKDLQTWRAHISDTVARVIHIIFNKTGNLGMRVRVTIVSVEKQYELHIPSVCS